MSDRFSSVCGASESERISDSLSCSHMRAQHTRLRLHLNPFLRRRDGAAAVRRQPRRALEHVDARVADRQDGANLEQVRCSAG